MKTIIIGKESLLTKYLKIKYKKTLVFSSRDKKDLYNIIDYINSSKIKINLILNNFYPSAYINQLTSKNYEKFDAISKITCKGFCKKYGQRKKFF